MDLMQTLQAVWDHSLDGIVVADANTIILDVNPAYCQLAGFSRAELIGQKTNVIRSGLTPRSVFDDMWQSLDSRGKWVGELVNRRKDGTLWSSFLSITRVEGPDGTLFVGIARDISDRRALEDQLREQSTRLASLLEAIVSGVVMFDHSDRCVVANRGITQLLACDIADVVGKHRDDLEVMVEDTFQVRGLLRPAEAEGIRNLVSRGPRPRYVTLRWGPVVSSIGETLGQIFTFRDITRETELDRMKSEFIATVSHELRTPMTSVKGALGLLLGGATGPVAPQQHELLTIAQNNVDRLIRLINDVLDLSRIESGRMELNPVPLDVNEAVMSAVRELDSMCRQRNLTLRTELAEDLPRAYGDPDRIGQVLVNLLGNAYKFTEPGGAVVIQTSLVSGEIRVQVIDNGPGIPPDQLETIFQRFHRAVGVATHKAGGTGLGLSIARAIIQEHGGRIWAENLPVQGAAFTFTLPVHPSARK